MIQHLSTLRDFTRRFQTTGELPSLGQAKQHDAIGEGAGQQKEQLLDLFQSVREQGLPDSGPDDWQAVRGLNGKSYEFSGNANQGVLVENSRGKTHEQRVVYRFTPDKIESLSVLKKQDQMVVAASTIDRHTPDASFRESWILQA